LYPELTPDTWIAAGLLAAGLGCYWAFFKEVAVETAELKATLDGKGPAQGVSELQQTRS